MGTGASILGPRFRTSGAWVLLLLPGLLTGIARAASMPRQGASCENSTPPQAVVTYVRGEVTLAKETESRPAILVGDSLSPGDRILLGKASALCLVWPEGEVTSLQGLFDGELAYPPEEPTRGLLQGALDLAENVWTALRSKLSQLRQGRQAREGLTDEPLAVRGPAGLWHAYPKNERVRPGPVILRWMTDSAELQYLALVWDANGETVHRDTTDAWQTAIPPTLQLTPGRRYWWVLLPTNQALASMVPQWFEVLGGDDLEALQNDLNCARELFEDAQPPSQLHVALGCVLDGYGLVSEARAEFETAARMSPEVEDYRALAGWPAASEGPEAGPEMP